MAGHFRGSVAGLIDTDECTSSGRPSIRSAESALGLLVISRLPAFQLRVPTFWTPHSGSNGIFGPERADARKESPGWLVRRR